MFQCKPLISCCPFESHQYTTCKHWVAIVLCTVIIALVKSCKIPPKHNTCTIKRVFVHVLLLSVRKLWLDWLLLFVLWLCNIASIVIDHSVNYTDTRIDFTDFFNWGSFTTESYTPKKTNLSLLQPQLQRPKGYPPTDHLSFSDLPWWIGRLLQCSRKHLYDPSTK